MRRSAARRRAGDDVRAFGYAARAALAGDRDGQAAVALGYLNGQGVPQSLDEAIRWFQRAGAAGNVDAMVSLAQLALQSNVGERGPDFAAGQLWAAQAATAGSLEGKLLLANIYLFAPPKWHDPAGAVHLFRTVAEAGSAAGALGLAIALLKSQPDPAQGSEAYALIGVAARQGLPVALYLAGALQEFGLGCVPDGAQAVEFYRRAALAGFRPAQTRFGYALMHGFGLPRDVHAGETWLRAAAQAGDAAAAAIVGAIYLFEGECAPNPAEAARWLTRAATLGHAPAASALASLYRRGQGLLRDDGEAAKWSNLAVELGSGTPCDDPARLLPGRCRYPDAVFAVA